MNWAFAAYTGDCRHPIASDTKPYREFIIPARIINQRAAIIRANRYPEEPLFELKCLTMATAVKESGPEE